MSESLTTNILFLVIPEFHTNTRPIEKKTNSHVIHFFNNPIPQGSSFSTNFLYLQSRGSVLKTQLHNLI